VLLIVNNKMLNLPIRKLFPTRIASSDGMNFEFMPELKWSFGYPGAIIFMILAGLAPYLYFKRKNWL
ncbi:TPA: CorA family divalent cation transporter, partial [Escherichia coli]